MLTFSRYLASNVSYYTLCAIRGHYAPSHAGPQRRAFSILRQGDSSQAWGGHHYRAQVEAGSRMPAPVSAVPAQRRPGISRQILGWVASSEWSPGLARGLGSDAWSRAVYAAARDAASRQRPADRDSEGSIEGFDHSWSRGAATAR